MLIVAVREVREQGGDHRALAEVQSSLSSSSSVTSQLSGTGSGGWPSSDSGMACRALA